jgi:hypothetical protein
MKLKGYPEGHRSLFFVSRGTKGSAGQNTTFCHFEATQDENPVRNLIRNLSKILSRILERFLLKNSSIG